jgi:hypothetical protein
LTAFLLFVCAVVITQLGCFGEPQAEGSRGAGITYLCREIGGQVIPVSAAGFLFVCVSGIAS